MAELYNLISCNTGTHSSIMGLYSNFLLPDDGKIVFLPSQPTQYYTLVYIGSGSSVGHPPMQSYVLTDYNDCASPNRERYKLRNCSTGEIEYMEFNTGVIVSTPTPCGCQPGYTINVVSGMCEKFTSTPITPSYSTSPYIFQKGLIDPGFGVNGVIFWEIIDGLMFPIIDNVPDLEDNSSYVLLNSPGGGFWDNVSGTEGRLNDVGIFSAPNDIVDEWVGFTKCLEISQDDAGEYNFGVGAYQEFKVVINGVKVLEVTDWMFASEQWHVFPITLPAGKNIIEAYGKEPNIGDGTIGFELYKATQAEVMGWTSLSELLDTVVFNTLEFDTTPVMAGDFAGWSCPPGYALDYCDGGDAPVCTLIEREVYVPCSYPIIRTNERPCDCFQVLELSTTNGPFSTLHSTLPGCDSCAPIVDPVCGTMERTISYAMFLKMPESNPSVTSLFKECCYVHNIFASTSDNSEYKNDFSGMYHQRQISSESCDFILRDLTTSTDYVLNNTTYGVFKDFGSISDNTDLKTFVVDWRKVLSGLGSGNYTLFKRITIFSIATDIYYLNYYLREFSESAANGTARIDVGMSGLLEREGIDFTNSGFTSSLRVPGFFGRRETKWEEDNIIDRNFVKNQVSMKQTNEYKFQTNLIPCCLTEYINDFLLFSDNIKLNDYNQNNHCYKYRGFAVKLESNDGTGYLSTSRKARMNLLFNDKTVNNNKRNY